MSCPICGSDDYPHGHHLATVYNTRYYCPDGERHELVTRRRWLRRRPWCTRCGEWAD